MRKVILTLLLLATATRCHAAMFELEKKYAQALYDVHYGAALKATGHPWQEAYPDHRIHVVLLDDQCWAIIADQQAMHTQYRVLSILHLEDGVWKELPYTVGGIRLEPESFKNNRDRIVLRLHLEKMPTRLVDALLDVGAFMTILDPNAPQ